MTLAVAITTESTRPKRKPWIQDGLPGIEPGGPVKRRQPHGLCDADCVSIPEELAGEWEQEQAMRRLLALCHWLDRQLDAAIKVSALPCNARRIEIFDALAFTVQFQERQLHFAQPDDEHGKPITTPFEVGHPLSSPDCMLPIMAHLGLLLGRKDEYYFPTNFAGQLNNWVKNIAYRLLLLEPRFQKLRRKTLPAAFGLPPDILDIALACRTPPKGPLLSSDLVNLVWSNQDRFRRVAKECPHLLPLLASYILDTGVLPADQDPIATLKAAFRRAGYSEAAWRYVARHGAHLFKLPWRITTGQPVFEVALRYLRLLENTGFPPPPPPIVVKLLMNAHCQHEWGGARIPEDFAATIDPVALRVGFNVADKLRKQPKLLEFANEFLGVCRWSQSLDKKLDRNQMRADWSWFVRHWRDAEAVQIAVAKVASISFTTRLAGMELGRWQVVPLTTTAALIQESFAMHNSVRRYQDRCIRGEMEIYSVRDRATGKREACIGFDFDDEWLLIPHVKGYANNPPTREIDNVADMLRLLMLACVRSSRRNFH
jgi:hypothetical protein